MMSNDAPNPSDESLPADQGSPDGDTVPQRSEPPTAPPSGEPHRLRRADIVFGLAMFFFVAIAISIQVIRGDWIPAIDNAVRNLVTGSAFILTGILGLIWFCFFSTLPAKLRSYLGGGAAAAIVLLFCVVRIDAVSGDMIPELRWVWQKPRDYALEAEQGSGDAIALKAGRLDFPRYFGPDGDGHIDTVELATDWSDLETAWKQPIGAGWSGFAAVNGYAVTMEQRGEVELVTCYEIHSGDLAWSHSLTVRHSTTMGGIGPKATPTIAGGRVYALGGTGVLRCLAGDTGELLWKIDIPEYLGISQEEEQAQIAWGRSNSPLVLDGMVVIPGGGPVEGPKHSLLAFAAKTGKEIWRGGDSNPSYASPVVGTIQGVRQIVSVNEATITGHDIEDGSVLWEIEWAGKSNANASTSQPHLFPDGLLITKGYGAGMARYDIKLNGASWETSQVYQKTRYLKTKLTSAVVFDQHVYGLSDGIMQCVRIEDGRLAWKSGRFGHGQVLRVRDKLLVVGDDGTIALLAASPDGYREYGRFQAIEGKTWNTLCLYGRYLLVRNSREAACIELPVSSP